MIMRCVSVPDYEVVRIRSGVGRSSRRRRRRDADEDGLVDDGLVHRVRLNTHGRRVRLELSQVHHLLPRNRPVEAWFADGGHNVTYSPAPQVSNHTDSAESDFPAGLPGIRSG